MKICKGVEKQRKGERKRERILMASFNARILSCLKKTSFLWFPSYESYKYLWENSWELGVAHLQHLSYGIFCIWYCKCLFKIDNKSLDNKCVMKGRYILSLKRSIPPVWAWHRHPRLSNGSLLGNQTNLSSSFIIVQSWPDPDIDSESPFSPLPTSRHTLK